MIYCSEQSLCYDHLTANNCNPSGISAIKNRFPSVPSEILYNYYSSGDEIIGTYTDIDPSDNMVVVHSTTGKEVKNYSWQKQERFKGRFEFDPIAWIGATTTAGWGFRHTGSPNYTPVYTAPYANILTPAELRVTPVFCQLPSLMFSSNITFAARNELLAKAIPALSGAVGSRSILGVSENHDMNMIGDNSYRNGWPRSETHNHKENWLHGDLKDVAYLYNCHLFQTS